MPPEETVQLFLRLMVARGRNGDDLELHFTYLDTRPLQGALGLRPRPLEHLVLDLVRYGPANIRPLAPLDPAPQGTVRMLADLRSRSLLAYSDGTWATRKPR